jgi:hypothetical protein
MPARCTVVYSSWELIVAVAVTDVAVLANLPLIPGRPQPEASAREPSAKVGSGSPGWDTRARAYTRIAVGAAASLRSAGERDQVVQNLAV